VTTPRSRAKKNSADSPGDEPAPSVLPLPEPVIEHHLATLASSMKKWKQLGHPSPVLLLTGPSGVGKRSVAHFLAQWLGCQQTGFRKPQSDFDSLSLFGEESESASVGESENEPTFHPAPCGTCESCQKAIAGTWVDFSEISAETGEGDSGHLKIEQFRDLKATQGMGAFDGAFRITLIRDADRMTPQAANSVLKLLEEPPVGWVIFLTASDPQLLLPTLVSRCQTLRLKPFPASVLEKLLAMSSPESSPERRKAAAELSGGSWGKALKLLQPARWEERERVFRFIAQPQKEWGALVDWAAQDPSRFESVIDQLESATAELVERSLFSEEERKAAPWKQLDGQNALSAHQSAWLSARDQKRAREFWIAQAERLFRARQEMRAPLNKKIILQDILLPWLESPSP